LKPASRKIAVTLTMLLLIAFFIVFNGFPNSQAKTETAFTPADKFDIAELNGTISFAVNGSYSEAILKNGAWTFKDLTLNNQSIADFGLNDIQSVGDLKFSTQDSNATILAYLTINYSFPVSLLSYTVEGEGKQEVNLGLSLSSPSDAFEWSVIVPDNVFLAEGQGWTLLPDDTLAITCATSNITVAHFDFPNSLNNNLPIYLQHSIALITVSVLAIVMTLATIIKFRAKKRKSA
jgi:hypothetical protein